MLYESFSFLFRLATMFLKSREKYFFLFSSSFRLAKIFLKSKKNATPPVPVEFRVHFSDLIFIIFQNPSERICVYISRLPRAFQISIPYYFSGVLSTFYRSKFRKAAVPFDGQMHLRAYYVVPAVNRQSGSRGGDSKSEQK